MCYNAYFLVDYRLCNVQYHEEKRRFSRAPLSHGVKLNVFDPDFFDFKHTSQDHSEKPRVVDHNKFHAMPSRYRHRRANDSITAAAPTRNSAAPQSKNDAKIRPIPKHKTHFETQLLPHIPHTSPSTCVYFIIYRSGKSVRKNDPRRLGGDHVVTYLYYFLLLPLFPSGSFDFL